MIFMKQHTYDLTEIFSSLANDTRLSIVRKLAESSKPVGGSEVVANCAQFLKLSQPTMSHHFAKLVSSGVIIEQKVGVEKKYILNKKLLKEAGIDARKF